MGRECFVDLWNVFNLRLALNFYFNSVYYFQLRKGEVRGGGILYRKAPYLFKIVISLAKVALCKLLYWSWKNRGTLKRSLKRQPTNRVNKHKWLTWMGSEFPFTVTPCRQPSVWCLALIIVLIFSSLVFWRIQVYVLWLLSHPLKDQKYVNAVWQDKVRQPAHIRQILL